LEIFYQIDIYMIYFLGTIGNILSILLGFSVVAIFELLFHFLKFFYMACNRIIDRNRANNQAKIFDASKLHIYP